MAPLSQRLVNVELWPCDMHGQQATVGGVGIMFRPVAIKHQITRLQHTPGTFVQLAFKDQELLMAVVAVAAAGHAGGHFINVKAGA